MFSKGWSKSQKELLQKIDYPGYDLYTIKGHLIEQSITKRYLKFRSIIENHDKLKIDRQGREVIYKAIEDAVDNQRLVEIGQWIMIMRTLDDLTYFEDELFDVCNCFILLKNEPIDDFTLEFSQKKREMFNNDPNLKLFFCQFAHEYLRHMENLPENTNVLEYLEARQNQIAKSMYEKWILPRLDRTHGMN